MKKSKYYLTLAVAVLAFVFIYKFNPELLPVIFGIIFTMIGVTLIYKLFVLCDSFEKFRAETNDRLDKLTGR